jgi:hypothetical protein
MRQTLEVMCSVPDFLCYGTEIEMKVYSSKEILQVMYSVPALWCQDRAEKYIVANYLLHMIGEVM